MSLCDTASGGHTANNLPRADEPEVTVSALIHNDIKPYQPVSLMIERDDWLRP